jgi:hypothetical protein
VPPGTRVQIGILQSPLERGEREQNGDWLSFPPTAGFPGSAATAEKIACPRFAADGIPICSPDAPSAAMAIASPTGSSGRDPAAAGPDRADPPMSPAIRFNLFNFNLMNSSFDAFLVFFSALCRYYDID